VTVGPEEDVCTVVVAGEEEEEGCGAVGAAVGADGADGAVVEEVEEAEEVVAVVEEVLVEDAVVAVAPPSVRYGPPGKTATVP
jgi:hypothetical protein